MDKIYHFVAGFVLAFLFSAYFLTLEAGIGIAMLAGLVKEIYDSKQEGNKFDTIDLLATILGGGAGAICGLWVGINILSNL